MGAVLGLVVGRRRLKTCTWSSALLINCVINQDGYINLILNLVPTPNPTQQVDLLLSFYVLRPLFFLLALVVRAIGLGRLLPADGPAYAAPAASAASALAGPNAAAVAESAAAAAAAERSVAAGALHPASVVVERRTFARTFPDGRSVLRQLFKKVELREACFRDVVVLYRAAPASLAAANENEVVRGGGPAFAARNLVVKRFASVPLADLELVMPDRRIFMPPQVRVGRSGSGLFCGVLGRFGAVKGRGCWLQSCRRAGNAHQIRFRRRTVGLNPLFLTQPTHSPSSTAQAMVNMIVTAVGGAAALATALRGGLSAKAAWPLATMLGGRAAQVRAVDRI
jgi:hypothetical protein